MAASSALSAMRAQVVCLLQRGFEEPWLTDLTQALDGKVQLAALDVGGDLRAQLQGVRVLIDQGGHGSRDLIDAAADSGVELWQVIGTGLDDLDVGYLRERRLRVAYTPGSFSADALAEHALLLILCFAKNLLAARATIDAQRICEPMNTELAGRTLGLVGFGASARALARRASTLGMHVQACDVADVTDEVAASVGATLVRGADAIDRVVAGADYLSLHVPLDRTTRGLIDRRRLGLLEPSAVLINVARGALVDEDALVEALRAGRLRGAGLDVVANEPISTENPLLALPNVIVTPHVAGTTRETVRRRCEACAQNVLAVVEGKEPMYGVPV